MPLYDYRCEECGQQFEARHGFDDPAPACPVCGQEHVQRLITTAPRVMGGMLTEAGTGGKATKDQLQDKWAEETPKLRKKLADKLGDDAISKFAPTLNKSFD